jgi:hypothetical protein
MLGERSQGRRGRGRPEGGARRGRGTSPTPAPRIPRDEVRVPTADSTGAQKKKALRPRSPAQLPSSGSATTALGRGRPGKMRVPRTACLDAGEYPGGAGADTEPPEPPPPPGTKYSRSASGHHKLAVMQPSWWLEPTPRSGMQARHTSKLRCREARQGCWTSVCTRTQLWEALLLP